MRLGHRLQSSLLFENPRYRDRVVKMKAMAVFYGQDDIFSVALPCNSLYENQRGWPGKELMDVCLSKSIFIYIYKITSHKYIWQYNVLMLLARRGLIEQYNVRRASKCQSKLLSDSFSSKLKKTSLHAL